jgi:EEF1A lysine methyltransferase 4
MAPVKSVSFESEAYWNDRFAASNEAHEWLTSIHDTVRILDQVVPSPRDIHDSPTILHLGCGISDLSLHLRKYVKQPAQVHNVDFSQLAIDSGRQRENESVGGVDLAATVNAMPESKASTDGRFMRWSRVDLLSASSVRSLANADGRLYDCIVDKSTSDAISCGEDVLFAALGTSMHPVEALALNLASVTATGGRWIAISYSSDRFWFLDNNKIQSDRHMQEANNLASDIQTAEDNRQIQRTRQGPADFWRIEKKEQLVLNSVGPAPHDRSDLVVHRPQVYNWLYILVRTDVSCEPPCTR